MTTQDQQFVADPVCLSLDASHANRARLDTGL